MVYAPIELPSTTFQKCATTFLSSPSLRRYFTCVTMFVLKHLDSYRVNATEPKTACNHLSCLFLFIRPPTHYLTQSMLLVHNALYHNRPTERTSLGKHCRRCCILISDQESLSPGSPTTGVRYKRKIGSGIYPLLHCWMWSGDRVMQQYFND